MKSAGPLIEQELCVVLEQWSRTRCDAEQALQAIEQDCVPVSVNELSGLNSMDVNGVVTSGNHVVSRVLFAVQCVNRQSDENGSVELTYEKTDELLLEAWNILSLEALNNEMETLCEALLCLQGAALFAGVTVLSDVVAMVRELVVNAFDVLLGGVTLNKSMCKVEYVLLRVFREVLKKGFCLPRRMKRRKRRRRS